MQLQRLCELEQGCPVFLRVMGYCFVCQWAEQSQDGIHNSIQRENTGFQHERVSLAQTQRQASGLPSYLDAYYRRGVNTAQLLDFCVQLCHSLGDERQ